VNPFRFTTESFSIHLDRGSYFPHSVEQALFWEKPPTVIEGKRISWQARGLLYAGIFGCRIAHKLGTVLAFEKRNIY